MQIFTDTPGSPSLTMTSPAANARRAGAGRRAGTRARRRAAPTRSGSGPSGRAPSPCAMIDADPSRHADPGRRLVDRDTLPARARSSIASAIALRPVRPVPADDLVEQRAEAEDVACARPSRRDCRAPARAPCTSACRPGPGASICAARAGRGAASW